MKPRTALSTTPCHHAASAPGDARPPARVRGRGPTYRTLAALAVAAAASLYAAGCITDSGDSNGSGDSGGSAKTYESYGDFPMFAGTWTSISNGAGSTFAKSVHLKVTFGEDGTFSGTYRPYAYDYTYDMPTAVGTIPVQVYNPTGSVAAVSGAIDFDSGTGVMYFAGRGETAVSVDAETSEIYMTFPTGFDFTFSRLQL